MEWQLSQPMPNVYNACNGNSDKGHYVLRIQYKNLYMKHTVSCPQVCIKPQRSGHLPIMEKNAAPNVSFVEKKKIKTLGQLGVVYHVHYSS